MRSLQNSSITPKETPEERYVNEDQRIQWKTDRSFNLGRTSATMFRDSIFVSCLVLESDEAALAEAQWWAGLVL